jgi:hypothetical protein
MHSARAAVQRLANMNEHNGRCLQTCELSCGRAVVGIVSRADFCSMRSRAFVRTPLATSPTDADVCQHVFSALAGEAWVPKSLVNVEVHDGIVELRAASLASVSARRCAYSPRTHRASRSSRAIWSRSNL